MQFSTEFTAVNLRVAQLKSSVQVSRSRFLPLSTLLSAHPLPGISCLGSPFSARAVSLKLCEKNHLGELPENVHDLALPWTF